METTLQGQRLFVARLGIGVAQGLALYVLYSAYDDKVWPATNGAVFEPLLAGWFFIPFMLISALGEMPWRKALHWTAIALTAIAILAFCDNWQAWPYDVVTHRPHALPSFEFAVFGTAGLFVAHALILGANIDRRFMATYPTHFDTAWKLAVQLALAGVFVGVFWLLLWLGAGLFNLIKLDFFQQLIRHSWFSIPITALAAAGALHLTDIRPAMVRGARTLLLTLLSWLLPLIALIVAGFVVSLPFTGLKALWSFGHASALLLVATAALVILINAAHQDGEQEHLPPRILRLAGRVAAVLPVPLAMIAAYALSLRVAQYGWSVERVMLAASVIAALGYAGGYAWAALKPGTWLAFLKIWNFVMSLAVLVMIAALFTPIASPTRISVNDQMARLESGKVSPQKFDFRFLRWNGGRYGKEALDALGASTDAYTRKMVQTVLAQTNEYDESVAPGLFLERRATVYPQGQRLPASFLNFDWAKARIPYQSPNCPRTCDAFLTDLDGDGKPEILIASDHMPLMQVFHQETSGNWTLAATIPLPPDCPRALEALRTGHFEASPPSVHWNDLLVNGVRLHTEEQNDGPSLTTCPR